MSLAGKCILVTRGANEQEETAEQIRRLGGIPIACPVITIELPAETALLDRAIREAANFDWIFFTSTNSVRFFCRRAKDLGYVNINIKNVKIASIGPKTRRELESNGLSANFMAEQATAVKFFDEFQIKFPIKGKRFLLPLSDIAHRTLPELVRQNGGEITEVVAYCNRPVDVLPKTIITSLARGEIDWVLFTSSSTVRNFFHGLQNEPNAQKNVNAASIGPSTSATLREYGVSPRIEAEEHTMEGLLKALILRE
jgi:uroporphyrinogen III methyltransferase/synthase